MTTLTDAWIPASGVNASKLHSGLLLHSGFLAGRALAAKSLELVLLAEPNWPFWFLSPPSRVTKRGWLGPGSPAG